MEPRPRFQLLWLFTAATAGLLSLGPRVQAAQQKGIWHAQGGAIASNVGRVATEDNGDAKTFGRVNPALGLRAQFGKSRLHFSPQFQFTPIGSTATDRAATIFLFWLSLAPTCELWGPFDLRFGPGFLFQYTHGHAGTVDLDNGTGTQTFYLPARSSLSRLLTWEVGIGVQLSSRIRLDLEAFSTGTLSSRRAYFVGAFLGWGLW